MARDVFDTRGGVVMLRRISRSLAIVVSVLVGVAVVGPESAFAHVTVTPSKAVRGGSSVLSFNTPNEKDDANTIQLELDLPTDTPVPSVLVKPMAGWTWTAEKTTLAKPVRTDDGDVTQAVTKITWTATAGGLKPGEFDLFTISAGPLPSAKRLQFKVLQTYDDGDVVRWIEPTLKGAPEPPHPAPVLVLTKGRSS
jgi:uncharacterized protein YcnI